MRQLSTDRPDKTESPYTVDAGHFQLELDLVGYARDHDTSGGGDTCTELLAVVPVNLKIGLLNNLDFQVVLESYNHVQVSDHAAGTLQTMSGFGDVTTRLKINFWGNDGGPTAFGAIPLVKFPSNQDNLGNNAVEGAVLFPLAVQLPRGWDMAPMAGVAFLRDENNRVITPPFSIPSRSAASFSAILTATRNSSVKLAPNKAPAGSARWILG
jgi:hypothetical protein